MRQKPIVLIIKLWGQIGSTSRKKLALVLILMLIVSFFEVISVGMLFPFLAILASPTKTFGHPMMQLILPILDIHSPSDLLTPLMAIFAITVVIACAMRLLLLWSTVRLSFVIGTEITSSVYRKTLYQPYHVHIARNSSEIISVVSNKSHAVVHSALIPALTLLNAFLMLISILTAIFLINPLIAIIPIAFFGGVYLFLYLLTRRLLEQDGSTVAHEGTQIVKKLQEGLGGIRDILIDGSQSVYLRMYSESDTRLRRAQGRSIIVSQSPRFLIESFGMLIIVGLAYILGKQQNGLVEVLPVMGVLAVAAQRMLPVLQQAYAAWGSVKSGQASLQDTLDLLEQDEPNSDALLPIKPTGFNSDIKLSNLGFRYKPEMPWVFRGVDLKIKKGERIGIIGPSGGGKSTLLDILMGLLEPTEGWLEIDGVPVRTDTLPHWQLHVAHVPQSIFIADISVAENVAFGVLKNEIDFERVRLCCRKAQVADLIESWPDQYMTCVGERGVRLSGGQSQRIGIARALYKKADVIIFDEATSALDSQTEAAVMATLENLGENLTIFLIAHRLTTLKMCTRVFELRDSRIAHVTSKITVEE